MIVDCSGSQSWKGMSLTVEMTLVELLNKVPQGGPRAFFRGARINFSWNTFEHLRTFFNLCSRDHGFWAGTELGSMGPKGILVFGAPRRCDQFGRLSAWTYAPVTCSAPQNVILLCRLWFYDCLSSLTEFEDFPTFFFTTNGNSVLCWLCVAQKSSSFPWFLAFFVG